MFASSNNPNDSSNQIVGNIAYFMPIAVADFRRDTRVSDTVTDQRIVRAIRDAMLHANRDLYDWRVSKMAVGYNAISEIPGDDYDGQTETERHYISAIYARAKYYIIEKYRDVDTTTDAGNTRADELKNTMDSYLAEYHNAIAAIRGVSANINVLI